MLSRSAHLLLPRRILQAMVEHAQAELPNECCGLLAGEHDGDVLRARVWYPLINEAASPVAYYSAPFFAVKDMRGSGYEIVAIYHSHPTSEPIPSDTDLKQNGYGSDVVNFIIGLKGTTPLVRGWWLTEMTFEEATWEIVEC
jgi:proteasome lid subunit RPN8/RPN11